MLMAATTMLAASTARGSLASQWVPRATMASMLKADTMLASGLCAPAAVFTADLDSPPPTGMPP